MDTVPIVDLREGGPPAHARQRREQALALRMACLGWLPCGGVLARLADPPGALVAAPLGIAPGRGNRHHRPDSGPARDMAAAWRLCLRLHGIGR
jgi:hypothetical protein